MRKVLSIALFVLLGGAIFCSQAAGMEFGDEIHFQVGIVNPTGVSGGNPRNPITPPSAGLDDHTLYIYGEHPAYTLYLVDTSGDEPDVVYQVFVPANVGVVYLPATLTGTYELQLYEGGAYYFYGYITL